MTSKRDLYQSYKFMIQRLVSSLVQRESDPLQSSMRRLVGSAFGSVMIAIIALAVAGVIGLVSPGGNKSWKDAGSVIVEEETGARFVWLADTAGTYHLHPVPNLGSGALLVGTSEVVSVSHESLVDAPRGPELGIPGTADSIPPADRLLGKPWTLCSLPAENKSGTLVPNTALVIGRERTSGTPVDQQAMLLRDIESQGLYLIWNSHRYLIPDETAALTAMGLATATQIRVGSAWLTALPTGKDLAPATPAGTGSPSDAVPGYVIGQVLSSPAASGMSYYLVEADGLLPVSPLTAALTAQVRGAATEVSPQALAGLTVKAAAAPEPADIPATMPPLAEPRSADSTVCASFGDNPATPEISLEAGVEGAEKAAASPRREQNGNVLADRVVVRGGYGALVQSIASPTDLTGPLFLVTDEGKRYAFANQSVADSFGYGEVEPIRMPASLVDRIEMGSALDPEAAKLPF